MFRFNVTLSGEIRSDAAAQGTAKPKYESTALTAIAFRNSVSMRNIPAFTIVMLGHPADISAMPAVSVCMCRLARPRLRAG
jgi:hypothetical protein